MSLVRYNTAEGGTNGAVPSATNSGRASGYAFSSMSIGASALTFDNTQSVSGSLAYKIVTSASFCYVGWNALPPVTTLYARVYFRYTTRSIGYLLRVGSGALAASVDGSGHLYAHIPGATDVVGTATVALNTWYRVEAKFIAGVSTAQVIARVYDMSGTLLDEVQTAAAGAVATLDFILFGSSVSNGTNTIWIDNLALSDQGWIGTAVSFQLQKANNAEMGSDGTTVTVANSGGVPNMNDFFGSVGGLSVFSKDAAYDGSLAYKTVTTGVANANTWTLGNASASWDLYVRQSFQFSSAPVANVLILSVTSVVGTSQHYVYLTPTSKLTIQAGQAAGGQQRTGTATYSASTWYRMDVHWHIDAVNGYGEVWIYDSSGVLVEYLITPSVTDTLSASGLGLISFGVMSAVTFTTYFDAISVSDQGFPPIPQRSAAMFEVM